MNGLISAAIAVLVGGALAFATAAGVVNVVNETPTQPEASVMDYGTTTTVDE